MDAPKCSICQGTGFHQGKICGCISGDEPRIPKELQDIFGDIFKTEKPISGVKTT